MRLEAASVRNWLEETEASIRLIDLVWAPWGEYVGTEAFRTCHGQYDERLVSIEPLRMTITATDWPQCRRAQVSVGFSLDHNGQYAASFGARFNQDGVMTDGEMETMYRGIRTEWPLATPVSQPVRDRTVDFAELQEWMVLHDAESRTIHTFWKNARNFQKENPEKCREVLGDAKADLFTVAVSEVGLFWDPRRHGGDWAGVQVTVPVIYDGRRIGDYVADFDLAGEDDDDWFWLRGRSSRT